MKMIRFLAVLIVSMTLVSCFGRNKADKSVEAAPVSQPAVTNPRPDRSPPPPQPQDGSMIVRPGGTTTATKLPDVSESDTAEALNLAEREIVRRKNSTAEADDAVSRALEKVEEDDLEKAFDELKKAIDKYPKTGGQ